MSRALLIAPKDCPHEGIIEILESRPQLEIVQSVPSLARGLSLLESWPGYDVVFVSAYLNADAVSDFVEEARSKSIGYRATYILLFDKDTEKRVTIANNMLLGFHGFLTWPFEEHTLDEIIELSSKVHGHDSVLRLRVATGLMLTEMRENAGIELEEDTLDDISKQVEASCEWYKQVTGKSVTSGLVKTLEGIAPTKRMFNYKGVSKRVKDLFERPFAALLAASKE